MGEQHPVTERVVRPDDNGSSFLRSAQVPEVVSEVKVPSDAKAILEKLALQVPDSVNGLDRQISIRNLVINQTDETRQAIKDLLQSYLVKMPSLNASDIDLGSHGSRGSVWYRIYGIKRPDYSLGIFSNPEFNILLQTIITERQRQYLFEHRNLDFSYVVDDGSGKLRYRADIYWDMDNLALNMRLINVGIRPFKDLEIHPNVAKVLSLEHTQEGLILVTGITGSGKSTTLDTIIDANNRTVDGHIIIIGAPIEYLHESIRCIVRHREVGRDVLSFRDGVVQSLRQDPDLIVIGEMRDPETIMAALEVTDSGHKVFSTLHTSSAVESIDRIVAEMPPIEQERVRNRLADVLRCIISQKLVETMDGKLVLAKEVMLATPSVKAAIKNNNTGEIYQMIQEANDIGMNTLEQDLRRLYLARHIKLDMAMNYANNKRRMQQLMTAQGAQTD
jgi:twitching motility protein PilT